VANLAAGALVFSQVIDGARVSPGTASVGIALWSLLMACALLLAKGRT
jgi:hypothetical protein